MLGTHFYAKPSFIKQVIEILRKFWIIELSMIGEMYKRTTLWGTRVDKNSMKNKFTLDLISTNLTPL